MPRPRSTSSAIDELKRLRTLRAPRERDLTIAAAVKDAERDARKKARATGGIGAAWESAAPAALVSRALPVSLTRGVLTIRAADAAARFELDRWLRSGGEITLARAAGVAIKRTKIV